MSTLAELLQAAIERDGRSSQSISKAAGLPRDAAGAILRHPERRPRDSAIVALAVELGGDSTDWIAIAGPDRLVEHGRALKASQTREQNVAAGRKAAATRAERYGPEDPTRLRKPRIVLHCTTPGCSNTMEYTEAKLHQPAQRYKSSRHKGKEMERPSPHPEAVVDWESLSGSFTCRQHKVAAGARARFARIRKRDGRAGILRTTRPARRALRKKYPADEMKRRRAEGRRAAIAAGNGRKNPARYAALNLLPRPSGMFGECLYCGTLTYVTSSQKKLGELGLYHGKCWTEFRATSPEWQDWWKVGRIATPEPDPQPRPVRKAGRRRRPDELARLYETGVLYIRVRLLGIGGLAARRRGMGKPGTFLEDYGASPIQGLIKSLSIERRTLNDRIDSLRNLLPSEAIAGPGPVRGLARAFALLDAGDRGAAGRPE